MASQAVLAFQTIRSRNLPPLESSVSRSESSAPASARTILPAEAYLEGTVRTYTPSVRDLIEAA